MPQKTKPQSLKRVSFFYDRIVGAFATTRTIDVDWQVIALGKKLLSSGFSDAMLIDAFCECVVLTEDLEFKWSDDDDVPDDIRAFEEFWNMVIDGIEPAAWFNFYSTRVSNYILIGNGREGRNDYVKGWQDAMKDAIKIWTPLETRPFADLTEEEKNDPNSNGVALKQKST